MNLYYTLIDTPIGQVVACDAMGKLCALEFVDDALLEIVEFVAKAAKLTPKAEETKVLAQTREELTEYFSQTRKKFTIPLLMIGTEFQQSVWNVLLTIPYGRTISYKDESIQLGNEKAIRAVSNANGKNKISIIVPCHRVIGSDGSLTGYAGGLHRKQYLLNLESEQNLLI
ncbi:methylated-DNA--[protein]-cysteine S-methyltransferase [Wohlfahrtiimonas larvae]|uniref:Methylated-DNA--protein-cysteine methyltransferase n=1 Tax=Wohlfahrtiimonas larvae TaxID=1157986 RepID=A0ABP9MT73_9GAMM|nr:methylated-DNA--[protein]-cysteine S-methyltransferase [Wohlfahrtiimonas larvae]